MSTTNDFDRIARAWLADGPTALADRVLAEALREVHQTHQRRRVTTPRRTLAMTRLLAAAAVVLIVVVGGFALASAGLKPVSSGSPSTAPTSAPTATSNLLTATQAPLPVLDATFVSPWHGYKVAYPTGWQITPGTGPWPLGENLSHGNPVLDQIISPPGLFRMRLVGASIALPPGMTMAGFKAFASPQTSPCTRLVPLPDVVRIDGVQALVSLDGCHSLSELGGNIYDLLVISGGRGYDFTLDGHLTEADALAWLAAIKLEPASAPASSTRPS